mgnify:CR=1 FL=1
MVGTYGDFIGGVIGTLVALYSAYLLVKTLGCQISVNSDVMDTNRNIVKTNNTAIYQSFLQVFDNKFHTMFDNYKEAKQAYRYESTRKQPQVLIQSDGEKKEVVTTEPLSYYDAEALDLLAKQFTDKNYTDKRTYLSRVKSAQNVFDEFYSEHRREMSVHFRNLYLLAKLVAETDNVDEVGNLKIRETDRVEYAKSIRGQLCEGEMLLLRYNCLTDRGEKMQSFVNQFNSYQTFVCDVTLGIQKTSGKIIRSDREASTLDSHFIELKKKLKEYIGYAANEQTALWEFSVKYSIIMEITPDKRQFKLKLRRRKNRPPTGSDGTPPIEKALNLFVSMNELKELYKDFIRESLIVSNFYLFNGRNNTNVTGTESADDTFEYAIIEYTSQYIISVEPNQA